MPQRRMGYGGQPGFGAMAQGGPQVPGQPQPPQSGRMPMQPAMPSTRMPMQQQQPGQPNQPPIMPGGSPGGGPTSPLNIESMLFPNQQPSQPLNPEDADGLTNTNQKSGPGESMPMIMLKLLQMFGGGNPNTQR